MANDSNSRDLVEKTKVVSNLADEILDRHKARTEARKAVRAGAGRMIFGIDATGSRSAAWAQAQKLQTDMFLNVDNIDAKLEVMLGYYRGSEAVFSQWHRSAAEIAAIMSVVQCVAGLTQIERIFRHALAENDNKKVDVVIFVGDTNEENEHTLKSLATELGKKDIRLFMFGEGYHAVTMFRPMTNAAQGECAPFDLKSPGILRDYLLAAAIYTTGNHGELLKLESKMETEQGRKLLTRVLRLPPPKQPSGAN